MIDRKYHKSLQIFSWVACGAMSIKLLFFTEYNTRRIKSGEPHVLTNLQKYADEKMDEFFGVDKIAAISQESIEKDNSSKDTEKK